MKYPQDKLYGRAVMRAVTSHLVEPVRQFGDLVPAYRIVWCVGSSELARAWDSIVSQRHLCDQVVAQSPSLQMFVSCISGIFKTGRPLLEQANPVYPAVSYWAMFDTATVNAGLDIPGKLSSACGPDAQVKPIKSFRFRQENNGSRSSDTGTLFTVLKDHNSWFIYEKIIHSMVACGAADVPSREPPNAKVVVMPQSKYLRQMPESLISLNVAGLRLDLEVFQGN